MRLQPRGEKLAACRLSPCSNWAWERPCAALAFSASQRMRAFGDGSADPRDCRPRCATSRDRSGTTNPRHNVRRGARRPQALRRRGRRDRRRRRGRTRRATATAPVRRADIRPDAARRRIRQASAVLRSAAAVISTCAAFARAGAPPPAAGRAPPWRGLPHLPCSSDGCAPARYRAGRSQDPRQWRGRMHRRRLPGRKHAVDAVAIMCRGALRGRS